MTDRLETLQQFHEEDPEDPFTRFALAAEHLKIGETDRALDFLEVLREENPAYIGTYYHLGKLYERLGRDAEARTTYEQGIQVAREASDPHSRSELEAARRQLLGLDDDDDQ